MDSEEANKFINSLVKNLQVLCHGHVNFSNSIQVIGHLYLNVDSDVNIDYIVNEKVCKSDTSSTVFVSKSYYSEPLKNPSEKVKFNKESQNTPSIRAVVSSDINNTRMKRNQQSNRTDSNIKSEDEFQVTKQPRMSHSCSPKIRARLPATPSGSSANNQSEKKLSRLTPANVNIFDLSSVKEEPRDEDHDKSNWSFYFEQQHPSILPHGSADELSNNFVAGLRDKSLGLYPVALHPSEVNTSFGNSSQSFLQSPSDEPGGSQSFQQSSIDVQSVNEHLDSKGKKIYPCKFCGKIFQHQPSLSRHVTQQHKLYRVNCPICGKEFTQKLKMKKHYINCAAFYSMNVENCLSVPE